MKKLIIIFLISFIFLGLANFAQAQEEKVKLYYFYGDTCSFCKKASKFLLQMEEKYPQLEIIPYEVFGSKENAELLFKFLESCGKEKILRTPTIFIGQEAIIGYMGDQITGKVIEDRINECLENECPDPLDKVDECDLCQCEGEEGELCHCQTCTCQTNQEDEIIPYPFIGQLNLSKLSLPAVTMFLAVLDGFNPCAMWILLFLLALLINVQSRKKIWLIAGTFILASGVVYFLLLSAWLNLFLAISYVKLTRYLIGGAALFFGIWQIKKFTTFKPGVCEVTSDGVKNKLQSQAEKVVNNPVMILSILGVIVLASAVNLVEFFCSAGLPAIYAKILSLNNLSPLSYHLYLLLYTVIFMLDDMIVFAIALVTLEKISFTDKYTKWSTLIGGLLIIILGFLLIFKPDFLAFG